MCYQYLILAAIRLPRFSIKPHQILIYLLLTLNISQANSLADSSELRQMTQLAEYITADYSEAVVKGEIVNQEEFKEMVDFADILLTKSGLMNPDHESFAALNYQVQNLKAAVLNKQDIEIINSHTAIIQDILLKQLPDIN